jgi:hypothetical protein
MRLPVSGRLAFALIVSSCVSLDQLAPRGIAVDATGIYVTTRTGVVKIVR